MDGLAAAIGMCFIVIIMGVLYVIATGTYYSMNKYGKWD